MYRIFLYGHISNRGDKSENDKRYYDDGIGCWYAYDVSEIQ